VLDRALAFYTNAQRFRRMRRFHRSVAKVKMCRSARLHILGAEAEERSDEAHDAVLGAVAINTKSIICFEPGRRKAGRD